MNLGSGHEAGRLLRSGESDAELSTVAPPHERDARAMEDRRVVDQLEGLVPQICIVVCTDRRWNSRQTSSGIVEAEWRPGGGRCWFGLVPLVDGSRFTNKKVPKAP